MKIVHKILQKHIQLLFPQQSHQECGFPDSSRNRFGSSSVVGSNLAPAGTRSCDKENCPSPSKRSRSSLSSSWVPQDLCRNHDSSIANPETPSKSLVGDNSITFTPPSILKDTLANSDQESTINRSYNTLDASSPVIASSDLSNISLTQKLSSKGTIENASKSPPKSKVFLVFISSFNKKTKKVRPDFLVQKGKISSSFRTHFGPKLKLSIIVKIAYYLWDNQFLQSCKKYDVYFFT